MKKKLVSVLLVAAMGASVLAGCGSNSVKEDGGEKKSESSGNNVLEFFLGNIHCNFCVDKIVISEQLI